MAESDRYELESLGLPTEVANEAIIEARVQKNYFGKREYAEPEIDNKKILSVLSNLIDDLSARDLKQIQYVAKEYQSTLNQSINAYIEERLLDGIGLTKKLEGEIMIFTIDSDFIPNKDTILRRSKEAFLILEDISAQQIDDLEQNSSEKIYQGKIINVNDAAYYVDSLNENNQIERFYCPKYRVKEIKELLN